MITCVVSNNSSLCLIMCDTFYYAKQRHLNHQRQEAEAAKQKSVKGVLLGSQNVYATEGSTESKESFAKASFDAPMSVGVDAAVAADGRAEIADGRLCDPLSSDTSNSGYSQGQGRDAATTDLEENEGEDSPLERRIRKTRTER